MLHPVLFHVRVLQPPTLNCSVVQPLHQLLQRPSSGSTAPAPPCSQGAAPWAQPLRCECVVGVRLLMQCRGSCTQPTSNQYRHQYSLHPPPPTPTQSRTTRGPCSSSSSRGTELCATTPRQPQGATSTTCSAGCRYPPSRCSHSRRGCRLPAVVAAVPLLHRKRRPVHRRCGGQGNAGVHGRLPTRQCGLPDPHTRVLLPC